MATTRQNGKPPSAVMTTRADGAATGTWAALGVGEKPVRKGTRDHMATSDAPGN